MRATFVLEDLLNMMIELETFGNENYAELAKLASDADLKNYFITLSQMELKHKTIFEGIKAQVVNYPQAQVDDDYKAYLNSLLAQAIRFTKINKGSRHIEDFETAFDLAVTLEKDAILFLIEIKALVAEDQAPIVDQLITEERSHLRFLYDYMQGVHHV